MNWTIGKACHPGIKRGKQNQDRVGVFHPGWFDRRPPLLVLADGMGGHAGGETASQLVVHAVLGCYRRARKGQPYGELLLQAVDAAHRQVRQRGKRAPALESMGSTLVAAVLTPERLHLVNVGDSRAYLLRGSDLTQLSYDQSVVADLFRAGSITHEEMRQHPQRNRLTMSISARREQVDAVIKEQDLIPGDRVMLCSDGLWAVVPEEEILYYLSNFPPQIAADDLVRQACEYGGPDNVSVIIAQRAWPTGKQHAPAGEFIGTGS